MAQKSREKIIDAAIEVYAEKGKHGVRMEEIADAAGINKAMVYYYFGNRNNLYRSVLKSVFLRMFTMIGTKFEYALKEITDPCERIRYVSRLYSRVFAENQDYVRIILEAVTASSNEVRQVIEEIQREKQLVRPEFLMSMLKDGIDREIFKRIDFKHFMSAFMGLQVGFFIIRPIFSALVGIENGISHLPKGTPFGALRGSEKETFFSERDEIIPEILLYGIVERS
ncbi:TetR/AcrR family transcriptional regulator [candidate division KSB1 bacterium]